ncbi:hypothetical protein AAVH_04209 [Aphelenchoides avenae]|nr:hypothetical protein AAVH_04209 [Aphelenchus avenae]
MQEFEPTIFEPVKGGHRPAKTKMRVRKMQFRERKKHRTSKKKDDHDSSSKKSKSTATAKDTKPKSIMQASDRCERELSTREIKKPFEKVKLESTKETPPGSSSSDERQTKDPEASSKSTKAKKRKKTADAIAEKSEKSLKKESKKEIKKDAKDKEKSVREVPSVKEKKESKKEIKKDAKPKRDEQKASDTVKTSATPPKKERTTEKPSATSDKPKDETQQPKPRPTEPQALPTLDDIDVHTAMPADMLRNLSTENVGTSAESLEPSKSPGANDSLRLLDHKSKEVLFEKLDEDIVLDDKVLQDIAKDLKKGVAYDNKLVDESLARKLMEIDNKTVSEAEIKKLTEQAYEQDETAMKIVDALTSPEVLGKVLAAEESKVLSEYFSGTRPQDEQVLNVLNVALEKILDRSHEFYANKEELKRFLEHRDRAKMRLLDALLSRNSSVLRNMWVNAYRYADMISRGIKGAYVLAGRGIEAAQEGYKYTAAVASASYEKANELAGAARDLARKSQEAVSTAKERTEAVAAATRGWIDAAVQLVTTTPPTPPSSRNSSLREDVKDPPSTCSSTSTEDSSSLSTSIKDDSLQSIVKDDSTRTAIPSEPSTNSNKSEPPPQPAPKTEPIRHTAAGAPSSELLRLLKEQQSHAPMKPPSTGFGRFGTF